MVILAALLKINDSKGVPIVYLLTLEDNLLLKNWLINRLVSYPKQYNSP